ncbi:MAG: ATP-dependent DNA ligase [Planctomycetota bacterium]|jgi:DNA ligase-1|nr:ATP-dependent DNA ligase [Planctomycetota bacterium]
MQDFTDLYWRLDGTTKTQEKVTALADFFAAATAADAAAAVGVLCGARQLRVVSTRQLRQWVAEETGLPDWLVEDSYAHVGDLAETLALLLPEADPAAAALPSPGLAETLATTIHGLRGASDDRKREVVTATWRRLAPRERIVWHKLVTGGLRVGVSRTLVARALAGLAGLEPAVMTHRLMGLAGGGLDAEGFGKLLDPETAADDRRPYPFFLASPLEETEPATVATALGDLADWQAEWKWDGMRAQIVRRGDDATIWSRGEELVNEAFPELVAAAEALPAGTVLDGELLAVSAAEAGPLTLLGFAALSKRAGRRRVPKKILAEIPSVFVAYDLLEQAGEDLRSRPLAERRQRLETLVPDCFAAVLDRGGEAAAPRLFTSPLVDGDSWAALAARRQESRARGVEGLMLKRRSSPYRTGRVRGDWWKWKIEPLEIDAVLLYAQAGHGRRAGLHSDYTLGVWDGERLVTIAKAYSGLDDAEIVEIDRIVRATTLERHGPVRICEPTLVMQLAFEGVSASKRHKAGLAVRFPRIVRWRRDKTPADAGTLDDLRRML